MNFYKVGRSSFEEIIRDQMPEKYFEEGGGSYKKRASYPGHCDKYNVQKDAEEEGKRAACINLNELFRAFRPALAT